MEFLKISVDYGVIGILGIMNVISLWLFVERLFFFKKLNVNSFANKKLLEIGLTKNLTTIGTIASNAPYIGLLGTVLAIMMTFASMSDGGIEVTKIMESLALALKATAAGLIVAIISMVCYNILARSVERYLAVYVEEV